MNVNETVAQKRNGRDAIKRLAASHGDLRLVIPAMVNKLGQQQCAANLGVSQGTISLWLRKHGYNRIDLWLTPEALEVLKRVKLTELGTVESELMREEVRS